MPMIAAVAGPAARMVRSMVSRPKREIEIGSGGKAGTATIANWPNSPARNDGSTSAHGERRDVLGLVPDGHDPRGREGAGRGRNRLGTGGLGRAASGGATASSSSRMSMPTGHQVMHRPQPTQPNVPNWSTQVANLWVSHWR